MKQFAAAAALLAAIVSGARAQSTSLTIHGRVVADETGDPLPHVRVAVYNDARPLPPIFTDAQGGFSSGSLAAGRYRLAVTKAGYAPVSVARLDAASTDSVDLRLRRGAAISGRVVDLFGEPVTGAVVDIGLRDSSGGAGKFEQIKGAQTDDAGEYRFGGLVEGAYIVTASLPMTYPVKTFYPDATSLDKADSISVRPGDEKTGVDLVTPVTVITRPPPLLLVINNGQLQGAGFTKGNRPDGNTDQGTAAIRGRVTRPDGAPVPRANVVLIAPASRQLSRIGMTGDDGSFAFERLGAADYRIAVSKSGYVVSDERRSGPDPGTRFPLSVGETRNGMDVVLARTSAVVGRVLDEFGDPVENASVSALKIRYESGRRHLENAAEVRSTDDRGYYRIYGLQPGQYLISAAAGQVTSFQPAADRPGYALTYFPGTPNPGDGQLLTVSRSQDLPNIDLTLAQVPTARITGRVLTSDGRSFGGSLWLFPSYRSGALVTPSAGARREPDGRFEFPSVPPGDYVIQADEGKPEAWKEGEFAARFVSVNGADAPDVRIQATAGSTISGRVTFDANGTPLPAGVAIVPSPADFDLAPRQNGSIARGDVRPDGTFEMAGIHGLRRLSVAGLPSEWALKAVIAGGVDITDAAVPFGSSNQSLSNIDVIVTDRPTEITGAVADAGGRASVDYTLLVFSSDRERWYPGSRYVRRVMPESAGTFTVRGLPPGDYLVAPASGMSALADGGDAWQDPEFLESLAPRASRVTLAAGARLRVNARVITP